MDRKIAEIMETLDTPITTVTGIGPTPWRVHPQRDWGHQSLRLIDKACRLREDGFHHAAVWWMQRCRNRMSKRGSPYLRHAIWLATSSAVLHDPALKLYFQKKRDEGKTYMASVGHACRKMVSFIYAIMRDNKAYIPYIPSEISAWQIRSWSVLKSNGYRHPEIRLKKFEFSLKTISMNLVKKLPWQALRKPFLILRFQLRSQTAHVRFYSWNRVHTRLSDKNRTQRLARWIRCLLSVQLCSSFLLFGRAPINLYSTSKHLGAPWRDNLKKRRCIAMSEWPCCNFTFDMIIFYTRPV